MDNFYSALTTSQKSHLYLKLLHLKIYIFLASFHCFFFFALLFEFLNYVTWMGIHLYDDLVMKWLIVDAFIEAVLRCIECFFATTRLQTTASSLPFCLPLYQFNASASPYNLIYLSIEKNPFKKIICKSSRPLPGKLHRLMRITRLSRATQRAIEYTD